MNAAVLFDLDDTLIDSDHLRHYRDTQAWGLLTDSVLSQIKPFTGVNQLLQSLRDRGCGIAIVTTSPNWYADKIVRALGLPCDTIVASGDVKYNKPDRAPSKLALERLGHGDSATSFVVGDRCVDIASGDPVCKWTIGATWGAKNMRDLLLSYPKFLTGNPIEVLKIVDDVLSGHPPNAYEWSKAVTAKLWLESPSWDRRKHLSDHGIAYKFARVYRGKNSWTDDRVRLFKTKNRKQWRYKRIAASLFAHELGSVIPNGSWVMFVPPAAMKGTEDYDDRWEMIQELLASKSGEKSWKFCQAVKPVASSTPAHLQSADSTDRDPETIKARSRWVGGIPSDAADITIIDDVLTVGGHLKAYHDLVREHVPGARIHLVAWAVYSSRPWNDCPSADS